MYTYLAVILAASFLRAKAKIPSLQAIERTTADRIEEYNYPVEVHKVHTADHYILTAFRIPYSPKLQNQNKSRPVAMLQHGLLSSSDCWILSGPKDALAYLLADAGYDVWLPNARGNTYSKQHETLSTLQPSFWAFSFHEMGLFDIPASIDYILKTTNETALHYVGHSMGTTVFFVLMSLRPDYNAKIKTSHMLAPVAFVSHQKTPVDKIFGPIVEYTPVPSIMKNMELMPKNELFAQLAAGACSRSSPLQSLCLKFMGFIFGRNSTHFNVTVLPYMLENYPAGTSIDVIFHYGQEVYSGFFRWYDHGLSENLHKYKQPSPPNYNLSNVVAPVRLYYSDNDYFADATDVLRLAGLLPNLVENFRVPHPSWNHLDFTYAYDVKPTINDRVIRAANRFEETGRQ